MPPVAASNAGGIPSVVENKKGGLLFEKGDVSAFAKAVISVFESDEMTVSLSESERELAAKKYDGDNNYRTLLSIYDKILNS